MNRIHQNHINKDTRRIKRFLIGAWGFMALWFLFVIGLSMAALYVIAHFVQKFW